MLVFCRELFAAISMSLYDLDCFGADNTVTTSDESSDAMRIFAASPPDNYVHKRFSDHYSSNESIGIKFRSRSNTNQSHKSEDASESSEVKIGAFATKKISTDSLKPSDAGTSIDEDFRKIETKQLSRFQINISENVSHKLSVTIYES